jgi:excisionase family DNA binding protein
VFFDNLVGELEEISCETGISKKDLLKVLSNSRFRDKICEVLLTKERIAESWNISLSFVNKLMKYEELPFCKIGRTVRFPAIEVHAWLQQRRRV